MHFNRKVVWSPVEEDFLKKNRESISMNQLTIMLAKSRNAITRKLREFDGKPIPGKKNRRSIIGKRKDLNNQFMRSSTEANFARFLKYNGIDYIYEPKVFFFEGVKRGTVSYLPDFYLPSKDLYIEVKGYLDSRGRAALNRFKRYFPEEFSKLRGIPSTRKCKTTEFFNKAGIEIYCYYNELNKKYRNIIPNWE